MVMRQMRASAKWIMLIVVVSFVGWMVFDVGMDVTGQTGGGSATDTALRVNGVKIDYQTFLLGVRNAQERQRNQTGTGPVTLEEVRQLEDQVVEEMVQQIILDQEYRRRGITVSDAEIRGAAQVSPPPEVQAASEFQTDGVFDIAKYQRYLASGADPQFLAALEGLYRTEIPRVKLYEQLSSGVYIPDSHLWRMYQDQNDSARVALITVLTRVAISDTEVEVTDADRRAYYRAHSEDFVRPETAFLSFVQTSRLPNSADSVAARELADELYAEVTVEGGDFEAAASRESADSTSRVAGGDLGMVPFGRFVPEFEAAVRTLRPGQVSPPVESQFGFHVIRLEAMSADSFHARHILVSYELRGDHLAEVEDRADTLDLFGAEQTEPTALDVVAAKLNVPVQQAPPLVQGVPLRVGGERVPDAGVWAFEARAGETSLVLEAPQNFYLLRLDSIQPEHAIPIAEITELLTERVRLEKKAELGLAMANQIRERLVAGETVEALAGELPGINVDTLGPFSRVEPGIELRSIPAAIGAAFGQRIDEYSAPIVSGNRNVYIVKTLALFIADSAAFLQQVDIQRQAVLPQIRDARIRMFLAGLRESAEVLDRRREIEEIQRDLAESGGLLPGGF